MTQNFENQIETIRKCLHRFNLEVTPIPEDPGESDSLAVWTLDPLPLMVGVFEKPVASPFLDGTSKRVELKWWIGVIHVTPQTWEEPEDWSVDIVVDGIGWHDVLPKVAELAVKETIRSEMEYEDYC